MAEHDVCIGGCHTDNGHMTAGPHAAVAFLQACTWLRL